MSASGICMIESQGHFSWGVPTVREIVLKEWKHFISVCRWDGGWEFSLLKRLPFSESAYVFENKLRHFLSTMNFFTHNLLLKWQLNHKGGEKWLFIVLVYLSSTQTGAPQYFLLLTVDLEDLESISRHQSPNGLNVKSPETWASGLGKKGMIIMIILSASFSFQKSSRV